MPESLTVALTGGTGFVGRHVLPQLLTRGHRVRALMRDPSKLRVSDTNLTTVRGDLFDNTALSELVRGSDVVVHIVGIIMEKPDQGQTFRRIHLEASQRLLAAAKAAGVKRWVHMSAIGARPSAVSHYHQTKWAAEEAVRASDLEWTIFRPSMIHGPDGEFMIMVRDFWTKRVPPFVPYFSRKAGVSDLLAAATAGPRVLFPPPLYTARKKKDAYVSRAPAGRLQPVWVEDVATCFAEAVTSKRAQGETYPMGGPDVFTWPALFTTVRNYLPDARNKKVVPMPVSVAKCIARTGLAPFNIDQVIMSQEDATCSIEKVEEDFDFKLTPFEEKLAEYAGKIDPPR